MIVSNQGDLFYDLGITDEEAYDKVETAYIMAEILGMDKDRVNFTSELGSRVPARTSLKAGRILFTDNYLRDERENSFYFFQEALLHESAHMNDMLRWDREGAEASERFIDLFMFFTEGLASQFDRRESSYPVPNSLFENFYSRAKDSDKTAGKVLREMLGGNKIFRTGLRKDDSDFYTYRIVDRKNITDPVEVYEDMKESYIEKHSEKGLSLVEEKSSWIEIEDAEAEILGEHYFETYRDTEEKIDDYLDRSSYFLERYGLEDVFEN